MEGAWIVFGWDMNAYPIAIFAKELEARRHADELGYGEVKFWKFGTTWTDKD